MPKVFAVSFKRGSHRKYVRFYIHATRKQMQEASGMRKKVIGACCAETHDNTVCRVHLYTPVHPYILVHECVHAAFFVYQWRINKELSIKVDKCNQECIALYTDELARKSFKALYEIGVWK